MVLLVFDKNEVLVAAADNCHDAAMQLAENAGMEFDAYLEQWGLVPSIVHERSYLMLHENTNSVQEDQDKDETRDEE